MIPHHQRRALNAIAVFAIVCALMLFLLPHTTGSHAAPVLWLALIPVFLFGIVEILSSQRLPAPANRTAKQRQPSRSALFQRPPPSA
jgi:uncharacterized protein YhhL (DUF1145 family)